MTIFKRDHDNIKLSKAIKSTTSIVTSNISNISVVSNLMFINLKIVLLNNIIIYENVFVAVKLFIVAEIYLDIWQKNIIDTVNISKEKWMFVNIILKIKFESIRMFKLNKQNRTSLTKSSIFYTSRKKWTELINLRFTHIFASWFDVSYIYQTDC